jgi:hypothetical protein
MNEGNHADMHRDHEFWLADNAMWRDEIGLWKAECGKALADLTKVENALRHLANTIDDREVAVDRHMDKITAHEHSLGVFEEMGRGDTVEMLTFAKGHKQEADAHVEQRRAHERLKKEHYTVMAHWSALLKELTRAAK